ncbi:MAG: TauD/TfdA family dioxygenase [Rhodospirillales bacterium]|nr:MAG: TauD/TfdA family dioxygenase [Rhodospirillales bacterium]
MAISVKRLHPLFFGEVSGVDLSAPLTGADRKAIADAIDAHAVLVFHDQRLDDDAQVAFGALFGPVATSAQRARHHGVRHRLERDDIADISNLDADNRVMGADDRRRQDSLGNRLWHTDASFRAVPGALSMLYAHDVPAEGGDTEFADMRAAWDALPPREQARCRDLVAEHSIWHSRAQIGFTDYSEAERAALPPVPQRLVRRHPGSGRATLYLASHASHIVGWPVPDGRLFLRELIEFATQPRFVHRHRWRNGDLVIWDNRCTMHRATPYDTTLKRDLRRVTTRDAASSLEEAAA